MDQYPKISIIIPCFNDAIYIEQAVNSALKQTYPNIEVIVVDDGSNEFTKSKLKLLEAKVHRIIYLEHSGVSQARNVGIEQSEGEYILVLDSDDYFEDTFCAKAFNELEKNYPETRIVTCEARRFNQKGTIDIFKPRGGGLRNFKFSNAAIGNSLFTKSDWKRVGGYDEKIEGFEDWEFFIRILILGGKATVIPEVLFNYRQKNHSLRLSHNKIKYELWGYIFNKHKELYLENPEEFIEHFIGSLANENREYKKIKASIDYRLGRSILKPFRYLKLKFKTP